MLNSCIAVYEVSFKRCFSLVIFFSLGEQLFLMHMCSWTNLLLSEIKKHVFIHFSTTLDDEYFQIQYNKFICFLLLIEKKLSEYLMLVKLCFWFLSQK